MLSPVLALLLALPDGGADPAAPRPPTAAERARYPWLEASAPVRPLDVAIPPPDGFARVEVEKGSFAEWLRGLPLRPAGTPVKSHLGAVVRPADQPGLAAVAALDVGPRDLQQCADSIIRLHAEWLWQAKRTGELAYRFTSGDLSTWKSWSAGERPRVGKKVTFAKTAAPSATRESFREWLDVVFTYAGTRSLAAWATKVDRDALRPGDFLVMGGDPGHAVLVLDLAQAKDGRRVVLLGEGFIPAQDFHVLSPAPGEAWFAVEGEQVKTPFWKPFPWSALRRL